MRIDTLLCRMRFVKTRGKAQKLVDEGHIRCNGTRVVRRDFCVENGDVLTLPLGKIVRVVRVDALPERRGTPDQARACYTPLDQPPSLAIAGSTPATGNGREEGIDPK